MPHKLPYNQYRSEKLAKQVSLLAEKLYAERPEEGRHFSEAILLQSARLPALFWLHTPPNPRPFGRHILTSWQPDWVDQIEETTQAARRDEYFEGKYYVLDYSSIVTASPLLLLPHCETILDMCSSPGGKAILAARIHTPNELVCNEVVPKRHAALVSNLRRCRIEANVTRLDPQRFKENYQEYFDLVMVDAPCSGQSLVSRGIEAEGAFLRHVVNANMTRQRRILANAAACVKNGGYLLYTTCTYSYEENEKNAKWFLRTHPTWNSVAVPHLQDYQSDHANLFCYRFGPQVGLGAGGFSCLLQKN